jgi:MFS family permease
MDRAAIAALRQSHGYPQFVAAATVARLADEMFSVGVLLLILDRTDSPTLAGVTIAAATFPAIVSGPVIGAWLDRTGRRSLIYKIDRLVLVAVLITILAAAGNAPDFVLPVLALITGVTLPVTFTGFTSMIPLIVSEEMLPSANSIEAASINAGLIGGPGLAGLLAAATGPAGAVAGEVALTLLALVLLLRIPDLNRGAAEQPEPLRTIIARGLRHIVHEPVLRLVSGAGVFNNISWGMLVVVFPLWAAEDLGSATSAGGALWAAFASGSLVGALVLSRQQERYPADRVALGAMIACGVGMLTWVVAGSLPVALALVVATALVEGPAMGAIYTTRQLRTPSRLQAQVMGTLGSIQVAAFALGTALGGPIVEHAGPRSSILIAGATITVASVVGAAARTMLREPVAR